MKRLLLLTLGITFFSACQSEATPKIITNSTETAQNQLLQLHNKHILFPKDSTQLLLVTTPNWNQREGTLQRYERIEKSESWKKVGAPISIILGRNGLGWGKGLHTTPKDAKYVKKEGDGRSPAGLFYLGNGFGYQEFKIDFPYEVYKRTDHCVDDSRSQWYNKIIDSTKVTKDYKSFEHMRLKNNLYQYGITVNHNPQQIRNAGSCIFMHIRSGNGKGTAGCTAMSKDKIKEVLKWLKGVEKPLLLQLPKGEVSNSN